MSFVEKLNARWQATQSMLCVGLDPDIKRLPTTIVEQFGDDKARVLAFNKAIIDATADIACTFKPQFAHYAALQMEDVLTATIAYIRDHHPDVPVILDAKRGDIGSTAERYAVEAFVRYQADAVTVNPYLGFDSIEPFTRYHDRGVIILCRTSNAGSSEFQTLTVGKEQQMLYEHVAQRVAEHWNSHGNCCLVVGATYPEELSRVREIVGDMPILVPGVGAQGGDLDIALQRGSTTDGYGLMVNSARGILYASQDANFADAARTVAVDIKNACVQHIARLNK